MTAVETQTGTQPVHYKTVRINNQDIFHREAGPQGAPVVLLPHGFPTSSNMLRNLIPRLAGSFRVVAPPATFAAEIAEHVPDDALTNRDIDILRRVATGTSNKVIASQLSVSEATIKAHMTSILSELGANDRTHAVTIAMKHGFLDC